MVPRTVPFVISFFLLVAVQAVPPALAQSDILLEKATNGVDADVPPGPAIVVGEPVTWTYVVTNTGSRDLTNVTVTDDQGVTVTCPGSELGPGQSMTCTGSGTAVLGQYANLGTASGMLPNESLVSDTDPSHYNGQAEIFVDLEKATNGFDADTAPGPYLPAGSTVTFTYEVTNVGSQMLSNVVVTDDQGVTVTCPTDSLGVGESMTCTATAVVQVGSYANVGTVEATLPDETPVSDTDPSHHFGQSLLLEKATDGVDADSPPGPTLTVGDPVAWTFEVTNPGPATITGLAVTDDQGVAVSCPTTTLADRESTVCTGSGFVLPGNYANVGTATALLPSGFEVSASDPSHYFGEGEIFDFGDAADPTYPTLLASDGARHLAGSVYLGSCVDYEVDGQPAAATDGDDLGAGLSTSGTCAVSGDDEDGVAFSTALLIGLDAEVEVTASGACTLSAWIDFAGDGDFSDADEELFPGGTALVAGPNALPFTVPADAAAGETVARFRCTTDGAVSFTGEASDGEVEDHAVTLSTPEPAGLAATKTGFLAEDENGDGLAGPGDTLRYEITVTHLGDLPAEDVVYTDTPDPATSLVVGSVSTTAGVVTLGNLPGDESVAVNLGTLDGGAEETIVYDVVLDIPLPDDLEQVVNQGLFTASNADDVVTDDPGTAEAGDATAIAVTAFVPLEIPILGGGGLLAFLALLGALGWRRIAA